MKLPESCFRIWLVAILSWFAAWLMPTAQAADSSEIFSGVHRIATPAAGKLPLGEEAVLFEIDWANPYLKVAVEDNRGRTSQPPPEWERAARSGLFGYDALRIQLVEPEYPNTTWITQSPTAPESNPAKPGLIFNAWSSWLPDALAMKEDPEWLSPLARSGTHVPLRGWVSRERLDALPDIAFHDRLLISLTNLSTGRTRFALILRRDGSAGKCEELRPWLLEIMRPGEYVAIHSVGEFSIVTRGDMRLAPAVNPRRPERAGVVLSLAPRHAGDLVDWARLPGVQIEASSMERDFPASSVISGLLWPNPLQPRTWMNRPDHDGQGGQSAPHIEVTLPHPRSIQRVVLGWPGVAGWSGDFNPGEVRLSGVAEGTSEQILFTTFKSPAHPLTIWEFRPARMLTRIRAEFPGPSQMALDRQARLAALQLWGPLDVENEARQEGRQ